MAKEIVANAIARLSRFEIEDLERVRDAMLSAIRPEMRFLDSETEGADEESLEELAEERLFLAEAEELAGKLLLVGLYRVVELLTKQALRHRYGKHTVKSCYKIDCLKALFRSDLKVDLTKVAGFKEIDEIRHLNNDVKHGGELPEPALKSFERLASAVEPYLYGIMMVVHP